MTAKELEYQTGTTIQIRGRGSLRDNKKEELYRDKPGWSHLYEDLHVLIEAIDAPNRVQIRLEKAKQVVSQLLVIPVGF